MPATLGQYELILRPVSGGNREFVIGEFTFEVRPGDGEDEVDFYDVHRQLDGVFERVVEVPPAAGK